MNSFESEKQKVEDTISLYEKTVEYASDIQKAILFNYQTLVSKVDSITQSNQDSVTNREKTSFVYNERSTYVFIDALLTTLIFSLAIVFFINHVWSDPYLFSSWAYLFLILAAPYLIRLFFSATTAFLPVNVYALWAHR